MATGIATLDFGVFPGASDASVAVTGQTTIASGSLVEAWIRPVASTDHSADEHMLETLKVFAGNIVAGTGFTIYGFNTGTLNEPLEPSHRDPRKATGAQTRGGIFADSGGMGTRIYGTWTIAWAWS